MKLLYQKCSQNINWELRADVFYCASNLINVWNTSYCVVWTLETLEPDDGRNPCFMFSLLYMFNNIEVLPTGNRYCERWIMNLPVIILHHWPYLLRPYRNNNVYSVHYQNNSELWGKYNLLLVKKTQRTLVCC